VVLGYGIDIHSFTWPRATLYGQLGPVWIIVRCTVSVGVEIDTGSPQMLRNLRIWWPWSIHFDEDGVAFRDHLL